MTTTCTEDINTLTNRLVSTPAAPDRIFGWPDTRYGDLHSLSLRLKAALGTAVSGDIKNTPVCLCTTDRTVAAAALLASLAGGPPLVLPHAFSKPVLNELHRLTGFKLAIVDDVYPLPRGTRRIMFSTLETMDAAPAPAPPQGPDKPWVHLFTGGSTGKPQLWTKTVRNLLDEAHYLKKAFGITANDRFLTTSPPYHIYGLLYSVLVPLLAGAEVITATPAFPAELAAAITNDRPTILLTVPAHYRALKHQLPVKNRLRMAFSSAGPLAVPDGEAFSSVTGVPIYDVYGSTETGGIASRCRAAGETGYTPFGCIDLKIKNNRLWVRSTFLSPQLPVNRECFFEAADRVIGRKDGTFTVIGRSDGVIKVGGKRVDLEEIKTQLLEIEGIRDALVLAEKTTTGRGNDILAVVETDLQRAAIIRSMDAAIEPHAKPRAIRVVAKMPVAVTGKYDRSAILQLFSKHGTHR